MRSFDRDDQTRDKRLLAGVPAAASQDVLLRQGLSIPGTPSSTGLQITLVAHGPAPTASTVSDSEEHTPLPHTDNPSGRAMVRYRRAHASRISVVRSSLDQVDVEVAEVLGGIWVYVNRPR